MPVVPIEAIATEWNRKASAVLAVPPKVPSWLDLVLTGAGASNLTVATLLAGILEPAALASTEISAVTNAADSLTIVGHGKRTGFGPVQISGTGDLPDGLEADTDYYLIRLTDNTFSLAESRLDAVQGTAVELDDDGTGTISLVGSLVTADEPALSGTQNAFELLWAQAALLGVAGAGALSVGAGLGYTKRVAHLPQAVMYSVSATLSAATDVTLSITPVE
jgi:hypothetical protein